jgi:excisionase family DNA binding protein
MLATAQDIWLTRRDAAAYARVSEATIGREVRSGRLRHARVGGRRSLRFRRHWIDDWLAAAQPVESQMYSDSIPSKDSEVVPRYIRSVRRRP